MPLVLIILILSSWEARAVDVVAEQGAHTVCEEFVAHKELRVFKDPTLFLPNLALIQADPKVGWYRLLQETPLLTSFLKGRVRLKRLGEPREFKNFGVIARFYELAEPRLRMREVGEGSLTRAARIVPVQLCGQDNLGFVLESDLRRASVDDETAGGGMPPSIYPNPVPELRDQAAR